LKSFEVAFEHAVMAKWRGLPQIMFFRP